MIQYRYRVLVATVAFSCVLPLTVQAAPSVEPQRTTAQTVEFVQQRILYVNPQQGTDAPNAGKSQLTPFKTITYALQQAEPGTVIQLAPGQYQAGETFPLKLKPKVILKGNEFQQGQGVAIVGGGDYLSRIFARQNITLLAAPDSQVIGVTITNPNTRGTGIWVESANPTIRNNTFANNKREGVFVTGNADPKIQNNQFINNDANGISVTGIAKGEIRGNTFQKNGFGLAIGGSSTPLVVNNQIRGSRSGLVVTEKGRPNLQGNFVENNSQNSQIAIAPTQSNVNNNDLQNNLENNSENAQIASAPTQPNLDNNNFQNNLENSSENGQIAIAPTQPNLSNNNFQNNVEEVGNEANSIPTKPPLPAVPEQPDNGIWARADRGILKEGIYTFPDGLVIYSNGNNAFCGFTSPAHYKRYDRGWDNVKSISEQDRARVVSDMRDEGLCPLADADKNSRVFVHDINRNDFGNTQQLVIPSVAAQPQDKWVLIMGNKVVVINSDGKVFTHDISGNTMGNVNQLPNSSGR
ncbi:right-handed parallel beta-helix repeat-containing protein [Chlorogloeopsis sp. ULAP02]|uniref:right-handed parallel beta-helix repeat-containing protein n=1 Tax=Chlorogloeopsis sp. ULAP02 TaxID=3107926 RepID=UPI00313754A5